MSGGAGVDRRRSSAMRAAAARVQAPCSAARRARCPSTQYQTATSAEDRAATTASARAASAPERSPDRPAGERRPARARSLARRPTRLLRASTPRMAFASASSAPLTSGARAEHRPPRLERSRTVRRPAVEHSALDDVGEALRCAAHRPPRAPPRLPARASHGRASSASAPNRLGPP